MLPSSAFSLNLNATPMQARESNGSLGIPQVLTSYFLSHFFKPQITAGRDWISAVPVAELKWPSVVKVKDCELRKPPYEFYSAAMFINRSLLNVNTAP